MVTWLILINTAFMHYLYSSHVYWYVKLQHATYDVNKLGLTWVSYTYKKVYLNRCILHIYMCVYTNGLTVKGAKHYYMLVITIIFKYMEMNDIKTKLILCIYTSIYT